METYMPISYLNDYIFCPRSIYFHHLFGRTNKRLYHSKYQSDGLNAHKTIDSRKYTSSQSVLQGMEVYSQKYQIGGKIDLYDAKKFILTERKKKIKVVYDGYIFQLYAQYYCMNEMGYKVNKIRLHSMVDNKIYPVIKPEANSVMRSKFESLIKRMANYSLEDNFEININKCNHCIYHTVCDVSPC